MNLNEWKRLDGWRLLCSRDEMQNIPENAWQNEKSKLNKTKSTKTCAKYPSKSGKLEIITINNDVWENNTGTDAGHANEMITA